MSFDGGKGRLALASGIAKLLGEGMLVEDVIEALLIAVRERRMQAGGLQNAARREGLLLFYADAGASSERASSGSIGRAGRRSESLGRSRADHRAAGAGSRHRATPTR